MTRQDIIRVCEWDRALFGADRSLLLESLWRENPKYSAVIYSRDQVAGYVLGRAGARATYLGPWIAEPDTGVAEQLFDEFLSRIEGEQVYVDVCQKNQVSGTLVRNAGFDFQRPLTRMYRGPNSHPGRPEWICGIAGPELG